MDNYRVAAIDVHKSMLAVVVTDAAVEGELPFERRRFGAMGTDLKALEEWLAALQVQEVVMESTAQYWKPVWRQLEGQCQLHLAQAHSNRARKGRKDDFRDAERLARRHLSGELILSFVPDPEQRLWRTLTRTKHQLTRDRVRLHNQVEALLEDARIKLSTCVTDLLGVSSRRMLEQLAQGETDPALLAALAEPMLRATPEQLIDALSAAPEMSTQANPQMLQSLSGAASSAARPAPNAPAHQRSSAAIIIRARLPCGSPVAVSSPA
jgi:transposase